MNVKELKEMIALMNENGLTEIEIEREGQRIRLKKGFSGAPEVTQEGVFIQPQQGPILAVPHKEPEPVKSNLIEIKAPMVGTFYRAPAPDAPAFVEEGSMIEPGQVICIVEAMKLMNEIKSEVKGKVVNILVENAQPVEFGHVLFLIEPA
ncbi:MAG: acetyl-CoA carboxylase biotin carboxyl carrier protein [Candidatus Omnitrophica bacterium]|nr:acetyl-CoA carboxylase biotin carboxyl carrier protein [Candidatus Omnitrophota bacterium]MDD5310690.1 acetyl-CoA carboxylase biotin carboxyl carrier protein [Candidatus Omnitrophota bacterium]MDD5545694.1 acetyl-CoA carboxylase biotin carboxyl carrier protein [Candidatus Omnitrophota bacterium]